MPETMTGRGPLRKTVKTTAHYDRIAIRQGLVEPAVDTGHSKEAARAGVNRDALLALWRGMNGPITAIHRLRGPDTHHSSMSELK
jgi:hypothetical protein